MTGPEYQQTNKQNYHEKHHIQIKWSNPDDEVMSHKTKPGSYNDLLPVAKPLSEPRVEYCLLGDWTLRNKCQRHALDKAI